jgi:hypothetical protein
MGKIVPFHEVTKELGRGQRAYLEYRIMGFGDKDALKLASRKDQTVALWRQDEDYLKVENVVLSHANEYGEEVFGDTIDKACKMLNEHLKYIIQYSVMNWDTLNQNEKRDYWKAAEMMKKSEPKYTMVKRRTYDETLLEGVDAP